MAATPGAVRKFSDLGWWSNSKLFRKHLQEVCAHESGPESSTPVGWTHDVGCYKSMQYMFNSECHKFTRESKCVVTRFIVCQIVCKVYSKVMSADNLISAFRKEINWHLPT